MNEKILEIKENIKKWSLVLIHNIVNYLTTKVVGL